MNKVFRWIVRSFFAPVTGNAGAIASTLGFFLAFLPLDSLRMPLLIGVSLLLKLNIIALFLGTLITVFVPNMSQLPTFDYSFLKEYEILPGLITFIQSSPEIGPAIFGGFIGLICYFFFHWFYNLGLKNRDRNQEQVFLDPAKRRWNIIIRMGVGFTILIVLVSTLFIESLNTTPVIPELKLDSTITADSEIEPIHTTLSEEEPTKINTSPLIPKNFGQLNQTEIEAKQEVFGFYVNWDKNSKISFKNNIDSITTLVPEWLQLTPNLGLNTNMDRSVAEEAKAHDIKVLPSVTNFINNQWDGEVLHQLFTTQGAEDYFIKNMLEFVKENEFAGINIDFEEIKPEDKDHFTDFMNKVYQAFHQQGLMVTLAVPPQNKSFDYASLAASSDRMIVMLYDEHHSLSDPGPIASSNWVKESLTQLNIPSEKLIISLGSYGYDWEENSKKPADILTFKDTMNLVSQNNLQIHWSQQSGNPYFQYKTKGKNHTVWFLDAATVYNHMKLAIDSGSRGIAVWRLGSEDPSIWNFINQPKNIENPANALETLDIPEAVHSSGAGDILQVASEAEEGNRTVQLNTDGLIQTETYEKLPKPLEVVRHGQPKSKEVVITFDDGPDPTYTPQILDILNKYQIKGTFFMIGENALKHPDLVERMQKEGHEIGSHTFTHSDIASMSRLQMRMELNANQRLFQAITGHSMTLFRPPYVAETELNSRSELLPLLQAQEMGYTMVGQSIDSSDWQGLSSEEIFNQVLNQLSNGNVILLHDSGGDRSNTVKALPMIIEELKKRGYTFTTVAGLIGKSESQIMPPANSDNPYLVYDKAVFKVLQGWQSGLTFLFYSAILLGILRLLVFIFLSRKQVKSYKETKIDPNFTPFVSVVIAAYNEEKVIGKTIDSILSSDYSNLEILVIDDGSTDDTAVVVQENYDHHPLVRFIQKTNGGKSSAVNLGFKEAKGEIVVALDADTLIAENAISLLVHHFKNEQVAAVSGNVKVGNKGNLLTNWQHIEYVTGFNLERRAFAALNCITVVPGAIGAWRKTAVAEAGYFKEDTLAEDTDLTLTLLRNGKKIEFEEKAYAYTEVPEDVKGLAKQRYRWIYGTLQCLWKHREALFDKKHHSLGFIALPNMWLFQYFYQIISPIADLLFIIALFSPNPGKAAIGFMLFYLLDFFASLYAFRLEKESPKPLVSLFLQRILYKQLMTYVVIKSIISAIMGVTVGWNKLKRNGNVTQEIPVSKVKENM
ncbi:polysaccharide deacetylase family protein [Mesobacillus maritimus]|uniref:polysaccharide deacetylase family protein n=1 Tax=Mesobacillus maritimus TaxID=1643336 RepID=UPI002040D44E|nr:polysaccharide deacetylase family protein [Mesobacillus maritimus]MCM3588388.1 polysaccharide deacetylase family protein [Mesobacillus maritimus]